MRVRIALGIIIILGAVLSIFGQLAIRQQRQEMMLQVHNYGRETIELVAQISSIPLQKYSIYQLENLVLQLERGELVAYCEVFDSNNNPLGHSAKLAAAHQSPVAKDQVEIIRFSTVVKYEDRIIGRVDLGINPAPALARINRTSLYIGIAFVIELLIIGLAVSLFIHKKLVAPILRLSETTMAIADGQFVLSAQAERRDEIGALAKSINAMSTHLRESYRTLELKVEQRTAELQAAKEAAEEMSGHLQIIGAEVQALLDNSPVGILFVNTDFIIERVNLEFYRIAGYGPAELIGRPIRHLFPDDGCYDEAVKIISGPLKRNRLCQATLKFSKRDGSTMFCSLRGRLTILDGGVRGVVLSIEDITTRLQMEEELLKIRKLESVSVLAGGIAHDFNNILMAIIGNISLAERMAGSNEKVAELLFEARKASIRAKDLTIKLLTFAKGGEPIKKIEYLPEILKESSSFVLSGSNVKCEYDIEEGLWAVHMDKGQITQVVQNLILNADQAMPEGGTISVTCRNRLLQEDEILGLDRGKYVEVAFADTGRGISSDIIEKVFDPYFTTKEKDSHKGSGLGLSIVQSILTNHGGAINVVSVPHQGSTFIIYLPATSEQITVDREPEKILPTGKGRILIMDDEETIHSVVEEMLTYLGYECLHASNGEEAVAEYAQRMESGFPVHAVIMDLTIPGGMGGAVAVKKVKALDPSAIVIVSSGYSDDPVLQDYRAAGFDNIISKPYQLLDLAKVLAQTLQRS